MQQLSVPAVIYKIMHYSDHSAVALAFSPEHGKLKLFMPRAYSKKGGFMTFVPGSLSYDSKDKSDLHKFVSFSHNPAYYFYTQTPEIMMRLNVVFDFFDKLYQPGESSKALWQMLCRFDIGNFRKAGVYAIYSLLRESGIMFELSCKCGENKGDLSLYSGELYCRSCGAERGLQVSADTAACLRAFGDKQLFRSIEISIAQEKELLSLFANHYQTTFNKDKALKSIAVFLSMSDTQPELF